MFSSVKVLVSFQTHFISRPYSRLIAARNYSRWAHRRPVRVIQPEDHYNKNNGKIRNHEKPLDINTNVGLSHNANCQEPHITSTSSLEDANEFGSRITSYEKQLEYISRSKGQNKSKSQKRKERTKEPTSDCEIPAYTKLSENDAMFSNLMTSVKSKKQREKKGYILLEGKRLIADAVAAGVVPSYVFFSNASSLTGLGLSASWTHLYKIPYKTITLWSDVTTSQGIVAICKLPTSEQCKPLEDVLPLTLVCDNVREPGNLGTILRTAVGAGCQHVLLTKGCMDPWDPKVLRSGAGAHFRMKILTDVAWADVPDVIGESLVCLADSASSEDRSPGTEGKENNDAAAETESTRLPIVPYYSVDYRGQTSVALVIGGETEGLSVSAYQLAANKKGLRVHIPLSNGLDSLNTGTALGVIVFEMKRQFFSTDHRECYQGSVAVKS